VTQDDPRIDALGSTAILTDTQFRVTLAPARPEARVVALRNEVNLMRISQIAALTQQGSVHIQIKAGFAPERKLVVTPAELALLYDLLDKFVTELPRVDDKSAAQK
jgi:hypothetical protein